MFGNAVVKAALQGAVADVAPQPLLAEVCNGGVGIDQLANLLLLRLRACIRAQRSKAWQVDAGAVVVPRTYGSRQVGGKPAERRFQQPMGNRANPRLGRQREVKGFEFQTVSGV
ncbi:hypothetical protein D3C76_371050 [compost metagenome]